MDIRAIVLAAGKGTRMNSENPKCAHYIIDKTMVEYVVDSLIAAKIKEIITVVGYKKEIIEAILADKSKFAYQEEQLGTAHAVLMAEKYLKNKKGLTLIAIGDMPFITKETYSNLIASHLQNQADLTVLTTEHPNPYGYGRIIRDENDEVLEIVEEKDCDKLQRSISEINASVYAVDNEKLFELLYEIKSNNNQHEYYLTDIVKIFKKRGLKVLGYKTSDYKEISGVNDKIQLMEMEDALRDKIIRKHLMSGVTIHNPQTVIIGVDVKLHPGSVIMPGSIVIEHSVVEKNAIVGPYSEIKNSRIGEEAVVKFSRVKNSEVKPKTKIGPYVNMCNNQIINKNNNDYDAE